MKVTIEPPPGEEDPQPSIGSRLGWFVGIAAASAVAVAVVAYALKALLV